MKLKERETQFLEYVHGHKSMVEKCQGAGSLTSIEAVKVYKNAHVFRLTESLGETFEGVWSVLGDELFYELSKSYISCFPSQSYNLGDYGESFPDFLRESSIASVFPFVSDLARLEWRFKEIFHMKDSDKLEDLETTDRADFRLEFNDDHRIDIYDFDVSSIWISIKDGKKLNEIPKVSTPILLYKRCDQVLIIRVSETLLKFHQGFSRGLSFSEIIDEWPESIEIGPQDIQETFQILKNSGLIRKML
ncbi:MAG: putative DNA-binding domain-containing protein [Bdellovibrionales bacterium]|nr:putative DNA-binding domain-containing protein [Bdellovibrionales bacterium]